LLARVVRVSSYAARSIFDAWLALHAVNIQLSVLRGLWSVVRERHGSRSRPWRLSERAPIQRLWLVRVGNRLQARLRPINAVWSNRLQAFEVVRAIDAVGAVYATWAARAICAWLAFCTVADWRCRYWALDWQRR
jgi:hypothetical protein